MGLASKLVATKATLAGLALGLAIGGAVVLAVAAMDRKAGETAR